MFGPTVGDIGTLSPQATPLESELADELRGDWERRWYGEPRFSYRVARSYEEAVAALFEAGTGASVLAGGQSLVPLMNLRLVRPRVLVDINPILPGQAVVHDGRLQLSAMSRYSSVMGSGAVHAHVPLLAAALHHVGNVRVRNRGTLGGGLAQGHSASELAAVVLALGAAITVQGLDGPRVVSAEDFFAPGAPARLGPCDVISAVSLPVIGARTGWSFKELSRRSGSFAMAGVAAVVELAPDDEVVLAARVGLMGVGERPAAADAAALSAVVGCRPSAELLAEVARAIALATTPRTDVMASADYRRRLAEVLTRRALCEAVLVASGRPVAP